MKQTMSLRRSLGFAGGVLMLAGCLTGLMMHKTDEHHTVAEFTRPAAVRYASRASAPSAIAAGKTAVVTADSLNIRSGPGANYAKRGSLTRGYRIEILEVKGDWARFTDGWVSTKFLGSSASNGVAEGDTVQITATTLNVRQGPGTNYARVDHLNKGASVKILEVKDGWGKIREGWISLKYTTARASEQKPDQGGNVIHVSKGDVGYVTADSLNIRSGPGTNYAKRGSLTNGFKVVILEIDGEWARVEDGWVALKYLKTNPVNKENLTKGDTVRITADVLNIRSGAGTNYSRVGRIYNGATEKLLEVNGSWGRIEEGWISLNYVKYVKSGTVPTVRDIEVGDTVKVTADRLNVRQGAGTGYARVNQLNRGETKKITQIDGDWGKTDLGWISLKYVVEV